MVRATVEASTAVVAALVEAATEVAAEATVAESTRSIQLNPAKSERVRWASAAVGSQQRLTDTSKLLKENTFERGCDFDGPFFYFMNSLTKRWQLAETTYLSCKSSSTRQFNLV